jgi:colicin import membrane protein
MLLKLVDRLVKEGNYAEALRILARASDEDPKNPYVRAYEARIRVLMDQPQRPPTESSESGRAQGIPPPPSPHPGTPSALSADQRRVAILSKVAAIISKANEYLGTGDFQRALEEVGRARLLDGDNPDIIGLEQRIREARQDAERFAESERERMTREQEEVHHNEMENLRREDDVRRTQEEQARRVAHEQKLNESLSRCRTLLSSGRLKEAQNELAFALVLDPNNHVARQLEQEIARAQDLAARAELQRKKQGEEERARAAEELRAGAQAAADQAQAAASQGAFGEALDIIIRAYVLDPTSSVLQAAEAEITAARDEAIGRERQEQLAKRREQEQQQMESLRRKAEEERQALLRQREVEAESRRKTTQEEIEKHLERAHVFLTHSQFEAALAEVALAFVIDPFSEPTRTLEQEILRAQESEPEIPPDQEPATGASVEIPGSISAHLDAAREHAATRDFAKAFDSIARAYAVDPLHPAVQECERVIQAAFVEYQGSLAHTLGSRKHTDGSQSASGRVTFTGMTQGDAVTASVMTFDDTSSTETPPPPAEADESDATVAWYRHRPVMYGGGVGALILVAAVFLISSPSGTKPDLPDTKAHEPETTEQAETREPPSTPVTLSEPQILPDDQPASADSKKSAAPAKLRREDPVSDGPVGETAPDKGTVEAAKEPPVEQPADPPVGLSKLDVQSAALRQQQPSTPAPGPAQTQKAPEVKRLQQPLIPDAILRSGMTGDVTVLVEIDSEGKPISSRVTRSTLPALNELFIEAVMASEFTPGVSADGRTTTYLSIPFRVGR